MTSILAPAPVRIHGRPSCGALPSSARRAVAASQAHALTVWETLAQILQYQVEQDLLLLWHYERRAARLRLLTCAPEPPPAAFAVVGTDEQLHQLVLGGIDQLAHPCCREGQGQLEQALAGLGLQAAVTTLLSAGPHEAILVTAGFRERWEITSECAAAAGACLEYIRACQAVVLASGQRPQWWKLVSQATRLWQQETRPSPLRTVHDLAETLADAARNLRPRFDTAALAGPEAALELAHLGARLVGRLSALAGADEEELTCEELTSQALLLVRDAYHLCRGTWPGCLAVVRHRPLPGPASADELRHHLIDWVDRHIETERVVA